MAVIPRTPEQLAAEHGITVAEVRNIIARHGGTLRSRTRSPSPAAAATGPLPPAPALGMTHPRYMMEHPKRDEGARLRKWLAAARTAQAEGRGGDALRRSMEPVEARLRVLIEYGG